MQLSNPPASIAKSVKPFISRANELAAVKPSISYFCKLYAARIILDAKLHVDNEEVTVYVSQLLDDIEQLKDDASEELSELLNDDASALRYMKEFAFEIFDNLNKKVDNKCVTKNTALEFIASVNFLQLTNLWEEDLTKEELNDIKQRIKYAKFQAARILKCIKNGLDPNDYEVEHKDTNASVEEKSIPNEQADQAIRKLESDLMNDSDIEKPNASESGFIAEDINTGAQDSSVSTTGAPETSGPKALLDSVINDSSFPKFVDQINPSEESTISTARKSIHINNESDKLTTEIGGITPSLPNHIVSAQRQPDSSLSTISPDQKAAEHNYTKQEIKEIMDNAEIISKAQKHAKFAISALNYEDKDTAIKELMISLSLLKQ